MYMCTLDIQYYIDSNKTIKYYKIINQNVYGNVSLKALSAVILLSL